jgi:hypothetical protein
MRFMVQDRRRSAALSKRTGPRTNRNGPAPMAKTRKTPAFIVHDLAQARAALAAAAAADIPVRIESAPGAALQGGAAWFCALMTAATEAEPGAKAQWVLDCGAEAGAALGALREGVPAIRTRVPARARVPLAALAGRYGARFYEGALRGACDLGPEPDPAAAAARFLARRGAKKDTRA